MIFKKLIIVAATLTLCFSISVVNGQTLQPSDANGLALEIRYLKARPPAYQTVLGSMAPKKGSWYGAFDRIAGWQLPAGELTVNAVRILPYLKAETVNISVSVMRGRYHDGEDFVGFYKARENETVLVKDLERFGVVPFEIKVIRVTSYPEAPTTLNKTKSLEVVGIELVAATLSRYKITLHNRSDKSVSGMSMKVTQGGRPKITGFPHGEFGAPLINAQETTSLTRPLVTRALTKAGGFEPTPALSQEVVIESVIFEDGTFEGELQPAAMYTSFIVGRRIELRRVLPVLEKAFQAPSRGAASGQLRAELGALSFDADEAELNSLFTAFPTIAQRELKMGVDSAIHGVRRDLIDQLERLHKSEASERELDQWIVTTRELYSKWLSRMEVMKVPAGK